MTFGEREHPLAVLRRIDWWLVMVAMSLLLVGLVFIHSATRYDETFSGQHVRQALFVLVSGAAAAVVVLVPYPRIMRASAVLYAAGLLSLVLLPVFGSTINGATRWYLLPGFAVQPSEFTKVLLILALAAWLRFKTEGRVRDNLLVPLVLTGVPALLVMRQPDLGSSLVYWPIMLGMCYAAGASGRHVLVLVLCGMLAMIVGFWFLMHDYQRERVVTWASHFEWAREYEDISDRQARAEVRKSIDGPAYQPWQSLIAIGSGGWTGAGVGQGPQNRYDFLPYRNADYIFAVIAEESGFLGVCGLVLLQLLLVLQLLRIAARSRERFGRLVAVGVAAYLGSQSAMHIAVCIWAVPATGLPMPLISYGGSSTMAAILALGLALNVGARRQLAVSADGFR